MLVACLGLTPAPADDGESSCKLHPTKVVNPGCVPSLAGDALGPPEQLPNLVPDVQSVQIFPMFVWDPVSETFVPGPPNLWFDTHAQNLGDVPMQLTFSGLEDPDTAQASQCVAWTAGRVCREQRPVGGFEWHAEHSHFHFTEFAEYELRRVTAAGEPDYSAAGLAGVSEKVSFCLMDSQQVEPDASPAPFYTVCSPALQGVSPGWTDIYDASIPGQQFDLSGLTDGRYALIVKMDYGNRLLETNDTDNTVVVTLDITGGVTQVAIVGKSYPPS